VRQIQKCCPKERNGQKSKEEEADGHCQLVCAIRCRGARTRYPIATFINSDKMPSSTGRVPMNELCNKSENAAQKKELDKKAKNERQTDTANLFVQLDAEVLKRDTQSIHSLNSDKLRSSIGRVPNISLLDKSKYAARTKEMAERQRMRGTETKQSYLY
jgi:hypothetical protein